MQELLSSPPHISHYTDLNLLLQLKESVNEHLFSDKIILWRKMAKIWLKIWLKVKENGTKKKSNWRKWWRKKKKS